VRPADNFLLFYDHLWHLLAGLTQSRSWIDLDPPQRRFHITLAYNLKVRDAGMICRKIQDAVNAKMAEREYYTPDEGENQKIQHLNEGLELLPEFGPLTLLRVALLKNGAVRSEYDLPSGEWLSRAQAYNPLRKVVSLKQYRRLSGIELISAPGTREKPPFVVSDLHLGHGNSIMYCRRPFSYTSEMDKVLIHNWNLTIGEDEEVIFLGDFMYGPVAAPASEYLSHLNGRITFVRGNHDDEVPGTVPFVRVSHGGEDFLCIHTPADAPPDFAGWIIHGHHHNNNLKEYPFIDFVHRWINVSIELTGYRPVSLDTILSYIKNRGNHDTLEIMPVHRHTRE
jgi:calcineurin-like phosphoesterase family protein